MTEPTFDPDRPHDSSTSRPDQPAATARGADGALGKPGWERAMLEKLAFASLAEQRTARRWRNFT